MKIKDCIKLDNLGIPSLDVVEYGNAQLVFNQLGYLQTKEWGDFEIGSEAFKKIPLPYQKKFITEKKKILNAGATENDYYSKGRTVSIAVSINPMRIFIQHRVGQYHKYVKKL